MPVLPQKFVISSACQNSGHVERPSCSSVLQVVLMTFFLLWFSSVCFKVFDVDHDGVLSRDELHEMVVALLEVWKDNRTDILPVSLHRVDVVRGHCPGARSESSTYFRT